MTRQTRVRLFAVLVLLVALTGILATPGDQQAAVAAPCCSFCENSFFSCINNGYPYPECGGDIGCCDAKTENCFRYCSFSC